MFSNVHIVLVNPSHPGNIGSTARAMKTMGFNNLSLVNPKEFPSTHADALAVGCVDILSKAKLFDDISSAVEGSNINIGLSARPRRALIPSLSIDECISKIQQVTRNYLKRQHTWWRSSNLNFFKKFDQFPDEIDIKSINLDQN